MNYTIGSIIEFSAKGRKIGFVLNVLADSLRVLLPNGKQTSVQTKKVLHVARGTLKSCSNLQLCRQQLIDVDKKRDSIAEQIDLDEVHQLLVDDIKPYAVEEIASFLFEPDDEDAVAAMIRALMDDNLYFKAKASYYIPQSTKDVIFLKEQQNKKALREQQEVDAVIALKNSIDTRVFSNELTPFKEEFIKFAAMGEDANISSRAAHILQRADVFNRRKLFNLLAECNVISKDENLDVLKLKIPVNFSKAAMEETQKIRNNFYIDEQYRTNMKDHLTWAIDNCSTQDRDDAFSVELTQDEKKLLVHIADPAEYIAVNSEIDIEAQRRTTSVYMPDQSINMLPAQISEQLLSLDNKKEQVPSITIELVFNKENILQKTNVIESVISVDHALSYEEADCLIAEGDFLANAAIFARQLYKTRINNGACDMARAPELVVKVKDDNIVFEREDNSSLSKMMVSEFMIWANHAVASWCHQRNIPCIYRNQDSETCAEFPSEEFEPLTFYSIIKKLKKSTLSMRPKMHSSLGFTEYTQVTSPLRRYMDLLLHRQIKNYLKSSKPFYDESELEQKLFILDESVNKAEELMNNREKYYICKYFQQLNKKTQVEFEAVVVEIGPVDVTFYSSFLCGFKYCKKPSFDIKPEDIVKVAVKKADPFDKILKFEIKKNLSLNQ